MDIDLLNYQTPLLEKLKTLIITTESYEPLCEVDDESFYLSQLEAVGEDFDIPTLTSEENKYNPKLEILETETQPSIGKPSFYDACKDRQT